MLRLLNNCVLLLFGLSCKNYISQKSFGNITHTYLLNINSIVDGLRGIFKYLEYVERLLTNDGCNFAKSAKPNFRKA